MSLKSGIFRRNLQPKTAAWQLIMTGIGYGMIALNLTQLDHSLTEGAIESLIRGLRN